MKRTAIVSMLLIACIFSIEDNLAAKQYSVFENKTEKVYICVSKRAKRYHCNKNCKGLRNCKHEIKTITLEVAQKRGLTPCKLCYQ